MQVKKLTGSNIWMPQRKKNAHKGEAGRVLVVGGSIDYVGAVLLAALSAYRAGADWVTVAAPEKVAWAINTFSPDIITKKVRCQRFSKRHVKIILSMCEDFDVLVIGNGIGRAEETLEFASELIATAKTKKVVDADAIKAASLASSSSAIFTPHSGELKMLLRNSKLRLSVQNRKQAALKLAQHARDNVILWKGPTDYIVSSESVASNTTGNPGMTVAGTGDVLAGVTAGLLGQTDLLFDAACSAAFVTGRAGDMLFKKKGIGFLASEVMEAIPAVMKKWR